RESLSFSKKMENHVGAVWYFIHDYNAQQSKGLSRHHYYRITTRFYNWGVLSGGILCLNDLQNSIANWSKT
ncbi:MAG: hypothetical protein ACKPKF_19370, partial [Microcystis panniformis]